MAAKTLSQALETWIASLRQAIQCVAQAEVFGSGHALGSLQSVRVVTRDPMHENTVPLRLGSGRPALRLRVFLHYTVTRLSDGPIREPYRVVVTRYQYRVTDRDGREIFAYHWHPEGVSLVREPHLHLLAAPFALPGDTARQQTTELAIDKAHFPTGQIVLPNVIRLLIEDFGVEPRKADWRRAIDTSP